MVFDRVVKFWADFVPVTDAVLLSVVPLPAVTWPRMVTVHDSPPAMPPPLQVTRLPLGPPWVQLPFVLVIVSCGSAGGFWITPIAVDLVGHDEVLERGAAGVLDDDGVGELRAGGDELAEAVLVTVIGLVAAADWLPSIHAARTAKTHPARTKIDRR